MQKINIFLLIIGMSISTSFSQVDSTLQARMQLFIASFVNQAHFEEVCSYTLRAKVAMDTFFYNSNEKYYELHLSAPFCDVPFRETSVEAIYNVLLTYKGKEYLKDKVLIYTSKNEISELIPNYYRTQKFDKKRLPKDKRAYNVVKNLDSKSNPQNGLQNRNLAIWHSHGWYYEPTLERWEWQRARLFTTVEDKYTMSIVLPYLVPMLENAGANVFLPRERDTQINEVIVDNDGSSKDSELKTNGTINKSTAKAFAIGTPPYTNENPFLLGTSLTMQSAKTANANVQWIPTIPEAGKYAVYVAYQSFDNSANDAVYEVHHSGGISKFSVNQQIGGGTWIYLGTFHFFDGKNAENAKVVLTNASNQKNKLISADAVRFGGGMGNVEREGKISGKPRYMEGARYYLQYAGIPDTLVWKLNENNDYNDDYQCRGDWANYLYGAPYGPTRKRDAKGLGIPIDLTFAFHTDAGISKSDTVIGTLAIYSAHYKGDNFPDGRSKLASRDLTDIVQTQIVDDLRAKYDSAWTRRGLWDEPYSENWRPTVPAMLLELLSHQNFGDMKFGNEPQFKFDVARAIYKGMLRFVAQQHGVDYVVQPLPITHFATEFQADNSLKLTWQAQEDKLEKTASPTHFIVYKRMGKGGYDNGTLTNTNSLILNDLKTDTIYSFRVTAVNSGGESMPSEELSAYRSSVNKQTVLIINGFDRIGGQSWVQTDKFSGFTQFDDMGVADNYDIAYTGEQYDFNSQSKWHDDDASGFGASYADAENIIVAGNTHDFSFTHGESIRKAGFSFVSMSDEAAPQFNWNGYTMVDYILGEERTSTIFKSNENQFDIYPFDVQKSIKKYCENGGSMLISGAYIGTDLHTNDSVKVKFAADVLQYSHRTNWAVKNGRVVSVNEAFFNANELTFNTSKLEGVYLVESPDAIEPAAKSEAKTVLRYTENNTSAGVAYKGKYGVVVLGFPFETIESEAMRHQLMKAIISYLKKE